MLETDVSNQKARQSPDLKHPRQQEPRCQKTLKQSKFVREASKNRRNWLFIGDFGRPTRIYSCHKIRHR